MPTWNFRVGGNSSNMQPSALGRRVKPGRTHYLQVDASAQTYAASDVLQLFDVPAGSLVTIVPDVETAEGGVATADLGWTEDPNGFVDALDLNVATTNAAPAAPVTKFFQSASMITLTLDNEIDAAILGFYVKIDAL